MSLRNSGFSKYAQPFPDAKQKGDFKIEKTGAQGKGKAGKPAGRGTRPRQKNPENKRTEDIFHNLCKFVDGGEVDFSDYFDAGDGHGPSVPPILACTPSKLHDQYDPSYLEKQLLPRKTNLIHYAVSKAIFEDTDEDMVGDGEGSESSYASSDEGDSPIEPFMGEQEPEDNSYRSLERRCNFIIWLLQRYPDMLSEHNSANQTPLCLLIEQSREIASSASKLKTHFLVDAARRIHQDEKIRCKFEEILNKSGGDQGTLIHLAIKYFGSSVVPFVTLVSKSTMKVQDSEGSTPLHIAVDVKNWKTDNIEQRVQLIQELVKRCDKEALTKKFGKPSWKAEFRVSPYIYMMSQSKYLWAGPNQPRPEPFFELAAYHLKDAYMRHLEDHDVFEHLHNGERSKFARSQSRNIYATLLINVQFTFRLLSTPRPQ
jgi:hypothetical protein